MSQQINSSNSTKVANDSCEKLMQHIKTDIDTCQKLLALLKNEREYLKKRDFESLDELIENKAQALSHLEQSAKLRGQMVAQFAQVNQNSDENNWQHILEQFNSKELLNQWQTLKKLIEECKKENETNGKMMSRSEHTVNRILNILRGQGGSSNLYTVDGGKSSTQTKHQIGEA